MPFNGILQGTPRYKHLARKPADSRKFMTTLRVLRQCSEISGDFEELHSDLLTKSLSRFALAKS
jgi:hypothetical protein